MKFLKTNALNYATSDAASKKQGIVDPSVPNFGMKEEKKSRFPMTTMVFFDQVNFDNPKKKIVEFNLFEP